MDSGFALQSNPKFFIKDFKGQKFGKDMYSLLLLEYNHLPKHRGWGDFRGRIAQRQSEQTSDYWLDDAK